MPITADTGYKLVWPNTSKVSIEKGVGLSPGPLGFLLTLGDAATIADLHRVQSIVGHFEKLLRYTVNNWEKLAADAGEGVLIATSISRDGICRPDANNVWKMRMGPDIADGRMSHAVQTMFDVIIAQILEDAKTGVA